MKKISVIVPVFNTRQYVREAIDSIILQKEYLHEIIIINDGSTDGSGQKLDNLYGKLPFATILHTKNHGQGYARNLGTEKSSGDYIYYFDSDDISVKGVFKKFQDEVKNSPELELFCFSGESFLDENHSSEEVSSNYLESSDVYKRKMDSSFEAGEDAFCALINIKGFYASPPLYIFKKSILKKNNFAFSSAKYEDEAFTHQLFIYAGKTIVLNDVYFNRRVRSGSTMQSEPTFQNILGYIKTVENLEYLKNVNSLEIGTIETIESRLRKFVKEIIILKFNISENLTNHQKKIFYRFLLPHFKKGEILIFYIKLSLKKKLRYLKYKYASNR